MTPQQAAHLRMLSTLPVKTHIKPEKAYRSTVHYMTPIKSVALRLQIRSLQAKGKTPRQIASIVNRTIVTVYNHLKR